MVRLVTQQPTLGSDLLALYRTSGSPDVFAQIMRAYGGMVFSVCYKVTKDAADAEDASQAAFLTLAVQCKTGAPITYLGPWLKKVAKRSALDLVRSRKRRTRREAVTAESRPDFFTERAGGQAEAAELGQIIRQELDQLPAKYRMPLVLHYFGGMSHDQIAKEMACTPAALGVRLHRARKMLGKRLTARNISLEGMAQGGAALGVAIAAAVHHVVSDRFVHSTQLAVMAVNAAPLHGGLLHGGLIPHGALANGALAGLPSHLGSVAQLVGEIGHSMARARVKMAVLTLVASIGMLGGAAEATLYLPESIRANLDFLAPSQILQNLIRAFGTTPTMRLQSTAPAASTARPLPAAAAVATVTAAVPAPAAISGPLASPVVAVNQPILALQVPVALPPVTYYASGVKLESSFTQANFVPAKTVDLSAPPATPAVTVTRDDTDFHLSSLSISGGTPHSSAGDFSGGSGGGHVGTEIVDSVPLPSAFPRSQNLSPTSNVGPYGTQFGAGLVAAGVDTSHSSNVKNAAATPAAASVLLQSDQVLVRGGDHTYHWSDATAGIAAGGTNSADLALTGVAGDGVVTISRLPVTTTLAPVRPTGHHFVGIWSIESSVPYSTLTLTAHYDEQFAESLGLDEKVLKLWVYDDNQWIRIMDSSFSRDLIAHALTGTYDGMPQYFAVSAPEPAGAMLVLGGAAVTLLRRRRHAPVPSPGNPGEG